MSVIKSDGKGVERFSNEENDCTVRALANAAGLPYPLAHKILAKAGRQQGKGVFTKDWHPVYTRLGFKLLSIHGTTRGARFMAQMTGMATRQGITLSKLLPSLKQGRYAIKVSGHIFAVVDGKVLDYGNNPAGCKVQAIYKLEQQAVIFDR